MPRARGATGFAGVVGVALLVAAAPAPAARLVNVRVGVEGDRTRVVFELDAPAGHQRGPVQAAAGGSELVVKLDAASGLRILPVKSELVQSVRVQPAGEGAEAHIALRTQHVRVSEMTLAGPPRLVFDLRPVASGVAVAPPARPAPSAASAEARMAVATPPPAPRAGARRRLAAAGAPSDFERNVERQLNERVGLPPPPRPAEAAPAEPTPAQPTPPPATAPGEPGVTPEGTAPSGEAAPAGAPEAGPGEASPAEPAPPPEEAAPAPPAAAPPAERPVEGPRIPRPALGPTGWLDVQIVLLAVAALLLLFLVWRRLGRRSARPAHEVILPLRFTEVPDEAAEETAAEAETPVPPLPLFEAAAPAEPGEPAPEPEAVAAAAESDLPAPLGEREAAPLLSGDLDAVVLEERPPAAWAEAPGKIAAPRGGEPEGELSRLVRELERRIAHLETRLEEAADARERLERHMAAQTEELRVQRAAIARTQRVLRSLARPEDLATEPTPRDPGRSGSS